MSEGQENQGALLSQELRQKLLTAKKQRKLTLELIADQLNMSVRPLQSFESEDFNVSDLSSFERGYLRNYARLLEVDLQPYEGLMPEVGDLSAPLAPIGNQYFKRASGKALKFFVTIIMLLIVVSLIVLNS